MMTVSAPSISKHSAHGLTQAFLQPRRIRGERDRIAGREPDAGVARRKTKIADAAFDRCGKLRRRCRDAEPAAVSSGFKHGCFGDADNRDRNLPSQRIETRIAERADDDASVMRRLAHADRDDFGGRAQPAPALSRSSADCVSRSRRQLRHRRAQACAMAIIDRGRVARLFGLMSKHAPQRSAYRQQERAEC